jgi:hypothetical protein
MVERTDTTEAFFTSECLTACRTAHGTSVMAHGTSVLAHGTSVLAHCTSVMAHGTSVLARGTSVLELQPRPQQQHGDLRETNKCTTASEQGQGPLRTLVNISIRLGPGTTADPGQYQH